jgi:hypothetical protein
MISLDRQKTPAKRGFCRGEKALVFLDRKLRGEAIDEGAKISVIGRGVRIGCGFVELRLMKSGVRNIGRGRRFGARGGRLVGKAFIEGKFVDFGDERCEIGG